MLVVSVAHVALPLERQRLDLDVLGNVTSRISVRTLLSLVFR